MERSSAGRGEDMQWRPGAARAPARWAWRLQTGAALCLLALAGLLGAEAARAGLYTVKQCPASGPAHFDASFEAYPHYRINKAQTCSSSGGGRVGIYQNRAGGYLKDGEGGAYRWRAPSGARFVGSRIEGSLRNANGIAAQVYATDSTGGYFPIDDGHSHRGGMQQMNASFEGSPRSQIAARLACFRAPCRNRSTDRKAYFQLHEIELLVRDGKRPSVSAGGALSSSGTVRGKAGYSVSASDRGGGVRKLFAKINGTERHLATASCHGDRGGHADRTRPCPSSASDSGSLDTSKAPFREGGNSVRFCARDYANGATGTADGPEARCTGKRTVTVDNLAPGAAPGLEVAGGSGWRSRNGFDLSWEPPGGGATPVVAATYRLEREGGDGPGRSGTVKGKGISKISGLRVPEPGAYRVTVRLRDSAGNTGAPAEATLRFDDGRPGAAEPETPPGWLGAGDFPYRLGLEPAEPGGPSGLAGYAVKVSDGGPEAPCEGGTCAAGEIALAGSPERPELPLQWLEEGEHWVTAVAVSGAGLASKQARSALLRVDRSDPVTAISGVPSGWASGPVKLTVEASDALSGMERSDAPDTQGPITAIGVGGGDPVLRKGSRVAAVIAEEGEHTVKHWARDLAGNEGDGRRLPDGHRHDPPREAEVRIDLTPPRARFVDPRTRNRPERIEARIGDELSGLATGRIEYRPADAGESFRALETDLEADLLRAELPTDELPRGAYELRAVSFDRAGNRGVSGLREDGSPMVVTTPLKPEPELSATFASGRRVQLARGGRRPTVVEGTVQGESGRPLAGASLELVERFDPGSRRETRSLPLESDASGRFRARLGPGPSRRLHVSFPGSRTHARGDSPPLRLVSRSRTVMRLAPQVARNGQPVRMLGRVLARGARFPASGKLVAIQYLDPSRGAWRPVEVLRTNRRGRFGYAYRFRTIAYPQRVIFRAVALPEAGWPYRPSRTGPRPVVVYPR